MKKRFLFVFSCLLAFSFLFGCAKEEPQNTENSFVALQGNIAEINTDEEYSTIILENENGQTILNVDENTVLMDAKDKYPLIVADLEVNSPIAVYVGPAMTLSEPPQTNALVILSNIQEGIPTYFQIKSISTNKEFLDIKDDQGNIYQINPMTCSINPYRTKNILTINDLREGKRCLIWPDNNYLVILD